VQRVDRRHDLHRVALDDRFALLPREQLRDLVQLLGDHVGGAEHEPGSVGQRQLGPERLHPGYVGDDLVDIVRLDRLHGADQLAGGRVE
jgi:hypothetical protein